MQQNDQQLARPFVQFRDTKTNIEALSSVQGGATAHATDTGENGYYDEIAVAWVWGGGSGGGSVVSVSGDGVDNTDPDNPVISYPTPADIGAEDGGNKQNSLAPDSTGTKYPTVDAVNGVINTKVAANSIITAGTKTKITYDAKGLVTGGADATTADIADSTNKRYVTDANLAVIGNTSGTNTGDNVSVPVNGWIADSNTWTRTGNHTFTLSGNATAYLTKGTFVKYTDSTPSTDYGVIYSSVYASGITTVTLITNTNYSMAAGAISNRYYSYMANPAGWPGTFDYIPSTSYPNVTINSAQYFTIGNSLALKVDISLTSLSGGSFPFRVGAPCTLVASGATGSGREDDVTGAMLQFYQYYNQSVIAAWNVSPAAGHRYKLSIPNLTF